MGKIEMSMARVAAMFESDHVWHQKNNKVEACTDRMSCCHNIMTMAAEMKRRLETMEASPKNKWNESYISAGETCYEMENKFWALKRALANDGFSIGDLQLCASCGKGLMILPTA